jgi:hypothetical protein
MPYTTITNYICLFEMVYEWDSSMDRVWSRSFLYSFGWYLWTCNVVDPQCFYCTTMRDVIFKEEDFHEYYINNLYTTHAVVCWVTAETQDTNPSSKWEGKVNHFGEDVDQGLLLWLSKDQELWWVEGGDLVKFVAPNMRCINGGTSSLEEKRGRGIYSPFQIRPLGADYSI